MAINTFMIDFYLVVLREEKNDENKTEIARYVVQHTKRERKKRSLSFITIARATFDVRRSTFIDRIKRCFSISLSIQ